MKNPLSHKSVLTVLSILSVLLGFSLLCLGSLAALQAMHIFSVFPERATQTESPYVDHVAESFPIFEAPEKTVSAVEQDTLSELLVTELPFVHTYYLRLLVESDMETGSFAEGLYEIWRRGHAFRIHRYHPENGEIVFIAISDGETVQITDYAAATVETHPASIPYSYEDLVPMPNFRNLFAETHSALQYEDTGDTIRFSCHYPLSSVEDHGEFVKETGLLLSYERRHGSDVLLAVTVGVADTAYEMEDYYFSLD